MDFEIGAGLRCDLDVLVGSRLLIQANSGAGKSWCVRRLLEQTFGSVQHLVIDPEGEFASLREKFDYVLAAKQGGDTAADPRSAKLLAERLLELKASAILDIYELKAHDRVRFVRYFLEALVNARKELWHPTLVVVDEAHVYCPQKGDAESAGAVVDLATRGRKRGFCAVLATQRLSKLHKDAAAECNNKLIGRSALDVDMRRASEELGFAGRDEQHQLRELEPGEFFAFGPALSRTVAKVMVGGVQTTHPEAGARGAFDAPPATEKIRALLPKLSDLPAEAEQERQDNAALRRDLATVRRELTVSQRQQAPPDEALIERRVNAATTSAIAARDREHVAILRGTNAYADRLERIVKDGAATLIGLGEKMQAAVNGERPTPAPPPKMSRPVSPPARRVPEPKPVREMLQPLSPDGNDLDGPETRILNAIAWFEALGIEEPEQPAVAFLAGYTYGGGGFNNPRGRLKQKGLIDYVPSNSLRLTDAGRTLAEPPDIPATNTGIHEAVMSVLQTPHQRILRPLLDAWPDTMTNEENAEAAGYAPNTGGHNNPRGRLKKMGLIQYPAPGQLRANNLLFPEGLA